MRNKSNIFHVGMFFLKASISMHSFLLARLIIFVIPYGSLINCKSLSKRQVKSPGTVLGEVYHFVGNEAENTYEVDFSDPQHVPLQDLRSLNERPNLETDGFTWVSGRHIAGIEDWDELSEEHNEVLDDDSIELVKELTGARLALSYEALFRDHNSPETPKPLPAIHSDLSPEGAEFFKREAQEALLTSEDPEHVLFGKQMNDKHVLIINTWRPLHTVQDNHLGFCKWDSLSKEDAIKSKIKVTDSETALQPWRYRKGQEWFYLSKQEKDEVYVFMQHDSRAKDDGHGINVPHASFTFKEDRNKPPTRMSFESAIIALVE